MIVSKHAKNRIHRRVGTSKSNSVKIANLAFKRGLSHRQTIGELRHFCDKLYLSRGNANNIRVYNKSAYLFHNNTLVTVVSLPTELVQIEQKIRERLR